MRPHVLATVAIVAMLVHLLACGGDDSSERPEQLIFGGDRPVTLQVPSGYDHSQPTALLLSLHGYGVTGSVELAYARLGNLLIDPGILILAPDGTVDEEGDRFWNAETGWCCDFYNTGVDDIGYLLGLIDEVSAVWNVDPARIYLFGHSNGAVMAYTLACERAQDIAAIMVLAGTSFVDAADCTPSEPVSVLHIHGTIDDTVRMEGGTDCLGRDCVYPSVDTTLQHWAGYNGCAISRTPDATTLDLDSSIDGAETSVERHAECPTGVDIELWTIAEGEHIPTLRNDFHLPTWAWLADHPKL
jgi:polyhydroxybutyrate depolymerase